MNRRERRHPLDGQDRVYPFKDFLDYAFATWMQNFRSGDNLDEIQILQAKFVFAGGALGALSWWHHDEEHDEGVKMVEAIRAQIYAYYAKEATQ